MKWKSISQRIAAYTAPTLHSLGGGRMLEVGSIAFAFMEGQGAGAGWDMEHEVSCAAKFVRSPHPIIFDVGANKGRWSATLSTMLGDPEAHFFLFEVAPYCFNEIAERSHQITNCSLVKEAVSNEIGLATLHIPTSFSGLASLHARRDVGVRQREYGTLTVKTTTLDEFANQNNIEKVAFIKFDIEGHELFALQGAERLLAERRIDALTFEFGSANVNSRTYFRDFWDLLAGRGYHLHRILPGGAIARVERYSERLEYFRGATNYIASLPR